MDAVNELLDKAKRTRSLPTDMALAEALHVGRAAVSGWRHGSRHPDAVACARLSELTGEPLPRVLGIVGEARAISAEEKRVWRRLATAAVFSLAAMMPLASNAASLTEVGYMHYAKSLAGAFTRWLAIWRAARSRNASPAVLA